MSTGSLVSLGGNLESPRNSKPSDYPAIGPMGSAGMASGADKLVPQTLTQEGPRHTEDGGIGQPVPTDRSRVIAENFKVSVNGGEGAKPTAVSIKSGVDLSTGQMTVNAKEQKY